jgi:hypothetical protein
MLIALSSSVAVAEGQLKLTSIKPTVFFVKKDNVLTQLGEATINTLSKEQAPMPNPRQENERDLCNCSQGRIGDKILISRHK